MQCWHQGDTVSDLKEVFYLLSYKLVNKWEACGMVSIVSPFGGQIKKVVGSLEVLFSKVIHATLRPTTNLSAPTTNLRIGVDHSRTSWSYQRLYPLTGCHSMWDNLGHFHTLVCQVVPGK